MAEAREGSDEGRRHFLDIFEDPAAVARYAEGPSRFVPGFAALHRMAGILLEECVGPDASILVLGAGGGLELKALAQAHPGWRFVGVDPAAAMLRLAAQTLGDHSSRVELVEGYIDNAPTGPFDGAVCLLTLHFLEPDERRRTEEEIRRRLKAGAPFVAAHGSIPAGDRAAWLSRYAAFAVASGAEPDAAEMARAAVAKSVAMLSPEQDEALLRQAGFQDVSLFYAAFTWRGWIAYA